MKAEGGGGHVPQCPIAGDATEDAYVQYTFANVRAAHKLRATIILVHAVEGRRSKVKCHQTLKSFLGFTKTYSNQVISISNLQFFQLLLGRTDRHTHTHTKPKNNTRIKKFSKRVFICPIAIAYSMGRIIKSVCVCVCLCVCPSASTLTVAFLHRFSPKLAQT